MIILGLSSYKYFFVRKILIYCYFAGILLSLRAFRNYVLAFTIRCALVILFANHNFIEMGKYRLINIFLGGAIGLFSSWIFDIYITARKQKCNTTIPMREKL